MFSHEKTILCLNCEQNIEESKIFLHERMCSFNIKKCPKCNQPFNIDDLNEHIKLEHSYIDCELCNNKFKYSEIENHVKVCLYQLFPCKYCKLNVLLKELEDHEEICGSTTEKCPKCDIYIEKRNYEKHLCLNKGIEYFNENIKINFEKGIKEEKKKIKNGLEKNFFDKNRVTINIYPNKNKDNNKKINISEINEDGEYKSLKNKKNKAKQNKIKNLKNFNENINANIVTEKEIENQTNPLNKFEKSKNINNNINYKQMKKKKKKNNQKEEEKEEIQIKNKRDKKKVAFGGGKNKLNKEDDYKFLEEDEYYSGQNNLNLHNIKYDIIPDKFKKYNNINFNHGFDNLEEDLLQEAIKLSLKEQ